MYIIQQILEAAGRTEVGYDGGVGLEVLRLLGELMDGARGDDE